MVSHKKATEILRNWGMEKEGVYDIYYEGTGNRNESAYYVGDEYVADGELYFCLTKRLAGQQMKPKAMYEDASAEQARFVGEVIGQLSLALANVEALVEEVNIYERVTGWAIPQLTGKFNGAEKVFAEYEREFGKLYDALPYVVISNQLLALAWFAGQEKFAEVYETNKKMTEWLVKVFDELRIV